MEFFFPKKVTTKKVKTAKEAFLSIEEKLDKLMQPNEKIHVYTEEDLIGYLSECFDLMIDIEKEMSKLLEIPTDYNKFKTKCAEFGEL